MTERETRCAKLAADRLDDMPADVVHWISEYLGNRDACRWRLASRWYAGVLDTRRFWISRVQRAYGPAWVRWLWAERVRADHVYSEPAEDAEFRRAAATLFATRADWTKQMSMDMSMDRFLSWSAVDRTALFVSPDNWLQRHDPATGACVRSQCLQHLDAGPGADGPSADRLDARRVRVLSLSPDETRVLVDFPGHQVRINDATSGRLAAVVVARARSPVALSRWAPAGDRVAFVCVDGSIHVWNTIGGRMDLETGPMADPGPGPADADAALLGPYQSFFSVPAVDGDGYTDMKEVGDTAKGVLDWSADGARLMAFDVDKLIVYRFALSTPPPPPPPPPPALALAGRPGDGRALLAQPRIPQAWELETVLVSSWDGTEMVGGPIRYHYSPDARHVAFQRPSTGDVRVLCTRTRSMVMQAPARWSMSMLPCELTWSPDGRRLACCWVLGAVQLWTVVEHSARPDPVVLDTEFEDVFVRWSPDGCRVLVCEKDGSDDGDDSGAYPDNARVKIGIWDAHTGRRQMHVRLPEGWSADQAHWSPDSALVLFHTPRPAIGTRFRPAFVVRDVSVRD